MSKHLGWVDPFIVALFGALALGLLLPIPAGLLTALRQSGVWAVALLFFLYGARLATKDVLAALSNWVLQGAMLVATFIIFPLLGLLLSRIMAPIIGSEFAAGILYLSLLPSTIQSAVVFVSIARGNVAAAISGATLSNVLGMFLTPLLVLWLMANVGQDGTAASVGGIEAERLRSVIYGLLFPFVVGQLVQPRIGDWVRAHKGLTVSVDRGTILLLVLTAVAGARVTLLAISPWSLLLLLVISAVLLAIMLCLTWYGGRALGLDVPDRIALLDCGSTKSLATGLPMASVLLPTALLAGVAVPLIIFHQLQLITCSVLARRLAQRPE